MNNLKLKTLVGAVALALAGSAWATNGFFLPGYGYRSQGMGGVGIAYGRDSLSPAANPANVVNAGMRADMGFGVFNPERHAAVGNGTGLPGGQPAGVASPFGFSGNVESDLKYFIVPEMGMTMPLTQDLSVGFAVVANGGMNTTYATNFFSAFGFPPKYEKLGVDMMQLLVPVSVGYRLNENHIVGASLTMAATRFRAYGLEQFANFSGLSSDGAHLTNQGFDYSYGAGIHLGWLGEFMDDKITLGANYASRTYMTKFDKYRGLFAEQGGFDIPENYGIGIAIKPVRNLIVAADVVRINYNDIASIGDRGPFTAATPYGPTTGVAAIPAFVPPNSTANPILSQQLGADDGMGFGWNNQTVYKIGVQYGVSTRLQVRAGYNYGKSPIPNDQVTFNTLAPATVERHTSVGFTYKANDNLEVTGTYMYVASNAQTNQYQNIVGAVQIDMHQNVFGLSLGWVLDPGVSDYGDTPSSIPDYELGTSGFYFGLGLGQSKVNDWSDSSSVLTSALAVPGQSISSVSSDNVNLGWKVFGGYQFTKNIGVEGGFVDFQEATSNTVLTIPAGTNSTVPSIYTIEKNEAWMLAAVGTLPITDKFSVFGKLGAENWHSRLTSSNSSFPRSGPTIVESDGTGLYYGAGASYALVDGVDIRTEWERFDFDGTDVDLLSAGFAVKF
jgi:long-chain fatty acid transport protein